MILYYNNYTYIYYYFIVAVFLISLAHGYFETVPPATYDDSGTPLLIACAGDQISLTCSHSNSDNGVTLWTFTPSKLNNCNRVPIDHNNPDDEQSCGPFMFENITHISLTTLNSTAVFTANVSISNTVAECRDSPGGDYNQVGNITICVIGNLNALYSLNFS